MSWRVVGMLLLGSMLAVSVEGQRVGEGFHGGGTVRSGRGPTFGGRPGFSSGLVRGNFGFRNFRSDGYGGFWIPWGYPWDYWDYPFDQGDWYGGRCGDPPQSNESYGGQAQNGSNAPIVVVRSDSPAPVRPSEPPKLIDVPADKESSQPSNQSPTLFVFANGTRLEARRYVLTLSSLDIELDGGHRTVPISQLDLPRTIAANRERGIEVKVPHSTSEIFLGF